MCYVHFTVNVNYTYEVYISDVEYCKLRLIYYVNAAQHSNEGATVAAKLSNRGVTVAARHSNDVQL